MQWEKPHSRRRKRNISVSNIFRRKSRASSLRHWSTHLPRMQSTIASSPHSTARASRLSCSTVAILPYPMRSKYDLVGIDNRRAGFLITQHVRVAGCHWGSAPDAGPSTSLDLYETAVIVGNFDSDRRLAGDRGHDPHAGDGERDGQVVGQAHDARDSRSGLQLDLELGDHRTGVDLDDADLIAEIEQAPAPAAWRVRGPWLRAPGSGRALGAPTFPWAAARTGSLPEGEPGG